MDAPNRDPDSAWNGVATIGFMFLLLLILAAHYGCLNGGHP